MDNDIKKSVLTVKRQTKMLIAEVGMERAGEITGLSESTLRRYYSEAKTNLGYFIPLDAVLKLEQVAARPYVSAALASCAGHSLEAAGQAGTSDAPAKTINRDVLQLAERFGSLMGQYYQSIEDNEITAEEAQLLLADTNALQNILIDMKRGLERGF